MCSQFWLQNGIDTGQIDHMLILPMGILREMLNLYGVQIPILTIEGESATIDAYMIEISLAMYYLSMSIIGLVLAISTDTVCQ